MTDADQVRALLGESIPTDGNETDTLFTDAQIQDLLSQAGNNIDMAVYQGWRRKEAIYANLVDTAEGSSKRNMGALYSNAKVMVKDYASLTGTETVSLTGRTRIGKIVRG